MTDQALANWAYCEAFRPEDDILVHAREAAAEVGCPPVSPGSGAMLTFLAMVVGARAVVEIGTGVGLSSLYLLRGMDPSGVLTTIDVEAEYHRIARETFTSDGIASERVRMITGEARTIIPRLADGSYDLVFVDSERAEYPTYIDHAARLLRSGGILVVNDALGQSRVPDPAQRDQVTTAVREALKGVQARQDLLSVLVPSGDGLLVAVRLPEDQETAF